MYTFLFRFFSLIGYKMLSIALVLQGIFILVVHGEQVEKHWLGAVVLTLGCTLQCLKEY